MGNEVFSVDEEGNEDDAALWDELLDGDDKPDPYATDLSKVEKKDKGGNPYHDKGGYFTSKAKAVAPREKDYLHSPGEALQSLLHGEKAHIDPHDVRKLLSKTAKQFEDPNLLNLNVHGLPIFSSKTLGIKRADMPQIPREHRQPFLDEIYRAGIGVVKDEVSAFEMYPTQNEISGRNVALKLQKYEKGGKEFPRILISKEGRILDGHHHWAMMAAFTLDHPKAKVPVYRLNVSVKKALALMHAYDKKHGIERASITGAAVAQKWNKYHDAEGRFTDKAHAEAVRSYAGPSHGGLNYERINEKLRGLGGYARLSDPPKGPIGDQSRRVKAIVDRLDEAIAGSSLDAETVVYRGLPSSFVNKLKPGDTFADLAYLSTTTNRVHAGNFGPALIQITLPKGAMALEVPLELAKPQPGNVPENEVLLPREAQLVFQGKQKGVYVFTYSQLAQKSNPYHDKEGRFTSKGSATQILGQLQQEHGKIMPSGAVFLNVDDQAEVLSVTDWAKWKSSVREVATKDLIAVQPDLDAPGIEHYLGGTGREKGRPSVVEFAGKLYLMDGHHRVSAEMLQGKETISADVHVQPDPLKGEAPGKHTPEGQQKLMEYLEQMTGSKFLPHGSVSKGATSTNDFDIIQKPITAAEEEKLLDESRAAEAKIWDQVASGTLTKDAAMQQIYGDAPDPITEAMQQIGFSHEPGVEFDMSPSGVSGDPEVAVLRFHNPETQHRVEVWIPLLTQKADKSGRYVTPFVSFEHHGNAQLQLIASLNASRLATWGFTAEAEVRGIARYRVTAVLDGRTSEFCRVVDGKIFQVADARKKVIECLDAQNPDDLKVIQPWPKQTKAALAEYEKMTPAELTTLGLHIPPYHPLCRTLLKVVTSSTGQLAAVTPTVPGGAQSFQAVTQADLKELGVTATQEDVDQWNAQIGMSPIELLSKMTGMRPQTVMTTGVGPRPIQFDPSGVIAINAKGESMQGLAFKLGAILDPFTGTYYLSHADLAKGSPAKETAFLKQLFLAMLEMGQKSSATQLAVGVAGNAAYYTKLGFLPDPLDWETMSTHALSELETGALQPLLASLGPEDALLVKHLLQDKSPGALSALVDLDLAYQGKSIGEWLLAEVAGTWTLDLLDDAVVAQAKAYLL